MASFLCYSEPLIPTKWRARAVPKLCMAVAAQSTKLCAKLLILIRTLHLHHFAAIQGKPCPDKQLAGVCIGFPQSYPQEAWINRGSR